MGNSETHEAAVGALLAGKSAFLSGRSYSGKTKVLNEFMMKAPKGSVVRLSPSGPAAVATFGEQITSFLHLRRGVHEPQAAIPSAMLMKKLRAARTVIVDCVDQMRIDEFQALRDHLVAGACRFGDFGGHQLIMAGDFSRPEMQIPDDIAARLDKIYGQGNHRPFQNRHWPQLPVIELSPAPGFDPELIEILDLIEGQESSFSALSSMQTAAGIQSVRITGSRQHADQINAREMENLDGGYFRVEAQIQGRFMAYNAPVEPNIAFKRDSRVIVSADIPDAGILAGQAGRLTGFHRDKENSPVANVALDDGRTVVIPQYSWKSVTHSVTENGEISRRVDGVFKQVPLLPGWAIPIGKARGLHFDHIHIEKGAMDHGRAGFALSRARSAAGLSISPDIDLFLMRNGTDPGVRRHEHEIEPA